MNVSSSNMNNEFDDPDNQYTTQQLCNCYSVDKSRIVVICLHEFCEVSPYLLDQHPLPHDRYIYHNFGCDITVYIDSGSMFKKNNTST